VGLSKTYDAKFDLAWNHYSQNTGAGDAYGVPFHFTTLKIKKLYLQKVIMFGTLNMVKDLIMNPVLLFFYLFK